MSTHPHSVRFPKVGALVLLAATGCTFDENLLIHNLQGTVAIPVEAATRTFVYEDENGVVTEQTITDPRLIGPVYLGLYASVEPPDVIASYSHPEIGPVYQEGQQGNAYPYGGTTIGDLRYACFEALTCRVASGRYATFDELATWFAEVLGTPVLGGDGQPILDGDLILQTCFDILEVTAEYEIAVVTGDRNGDGTADSQDLDFKLNGDFFEADFTIWQQEFFWDEREQEETGCTPGEDCTGFSLWGFMDAPDVISNKFTTCDPTLGFEDQNYANDYTGGKAFSDVLNQPSMYISSGDWVATESFVWKNIYEEPRLVLDFEVTQ